MVVKTFSRPLIYWGIASAFALTAPQAIAASTWKVLNCSDAIIGTGKNGTLRYAAANADSGDTIDLSALTCSSISLETGAITIKQNDLTIVGPADRGLALLGEGYAQGTGSAGDRIFKHTGTGTLTINNMNMVGGTYESSSGPHAFGGCIYSYGSVYVRNSLISGCLAHADAGLGAGGAIFVGGKATIKYSAIVGSEAYGDAYAYGGGIAAQSLNLRYSFISYNAAYTNYVGGIRKTFGGGIGMFSVGAVQIANSTINNNSSSGHGGGIGIVASSSANTLSVSVTNSTISENDASDYAGGLYTDAGAVTLQNSTIAFNLANSVYHGSNALGAGATISASAGAGPVTLDLESTLISNNYLFNEKAVINSSPQVYDLSTVDGMGSNVVTVTGHNNLVERKVGSIKLPSDTIFACPDLEKLKNNGGQTYTHALHSKSPAIDSGNNVANLPEDQRGVPPSDPTPYPYPRVSGSQTDIGSYEVQQNEIIFNSGFGDSCSFQPPL